VNLEILVHFYKDFVKVVLDQGYYFISQWNLDNWNTGTECAVIPALRRLRQEDHEFEASLGYVASLRLSWST
jgi:hypothetical protein